MISSCASACVSVWTQRKFKEFKFFDQTTIFTSLKRITFFKLNWEKEMEWIDKDSYMRWGT